MNKKQIAFIICVNNDIYFEECKYYIDRLLKPAGYSIDIIAIREADSMCPAYNAGMQSSDAKYKIYMHQDVMIRDVHFLESIIKLFTENEKVGMIGMIGGTRMPKTGVTYRAWNVGMVDCRDPDMAYFMAGAKDMKREDTIVEAVDGLLIATQYDVPWREDLFTHFDFYDVSQSFEMRKAGYEILIPYQKKPWVIHDSSFAKLTYYDEARKICLKEYPKYLYAEDGFEFTYDREWNDLSDLLAEQVQMLISSGQWEQTGQMMESYRSTGRKSSAMEMLGVLYDIYRKEQLSDVKHSFFENVQDYADIYRKYFSVRFLLRRMELGMEEAAYQELLDAIRNEYVSYEALEVMLLCSVVEKRGVIEKLIGIYEEAGLGRYRIACQKLYQVIKEKPLPVTYSQKTSCEQ
jgi:hypothetical protein